MFTFQLSKTYISSHQETFVLTFFQKFFKNIKDSGYNSSTPAHLVKTDSLLVVLFRIFLNLQNRLLQENSRQLFLFLFLHLAFTLREKCSYSGLFWSGFSPHSGLIRRDTQYLCLFSSNAGQC